MVLRLGNYPVGTKGLGQMVGWERDQNEGLRKYNELHPQVQVGRKFQSLPEKPEITEKAKTHRTLEYVPLLLMNGPYGPFKEKKKSLLHVLPQQWAAKLSRVKRSPQEGKNWKDSPLVESIWRKRIPKDGVGNDCYRMIGKKAGAQKSGERGELWKLKKSPSIFRKK